MIKTRGIALGLVVVAVAGLFAVTMVRHTSAGVTGEAAEPCCFANPQYSGTCQVVPAEGESCGSILAYLNNPNASGKSYCGGTSIRGGWRQVSCE
jgi:hypothetical protein